MMTLHHVFSVLTPALTTLTFLFVTGCGGNDTVPLPPAGPTPLPVPPNATANTYILPDAVAKTHWAFGEEPVVIDKGERLRWVNADTLTHVIVADLPDATDFRKTAELPSGGEESFVMNRLGTTGIHCAIHPSMTGTLIVRER